MQPFQVSDTTVRLLAIHKLVFAKSIYWICLWNVKNLPKFRK